MTDHFGESPVGLRETEAKAISSALMADLFRAAVLRWGVLLSTGYLLIWGTVALTARFATGVDSARWWLGLAGLLLVWLIACVLGWRERPSSDQARAVVDGRRHLGGLLMAHDMKGFEPWAQRMAIPSPLRVRWRGGQASTALALAAVFLVCALLSPMPRWDGVSAGMNVQNTIDSLDDQVQVLEEERILDEPQAEAIREDMAQVAEDAKGMDPSRTFEALDHLADQLDQTAAEAADEALRKMNDSAAAEALAKALQQDTGQLSPQQMSQAMQALAQLTEEAVGSDLTAGLSPEMAAALSQAAASGLDAETLKKLAEMMSGQQGDLQATLEALQAANLIEGRLLDIESDLDPAELLEWLENQGECDAASICKACKSGKVGRGGITRGPGHVEMIWKDPSSKEGASFDPQVLPPSRLRDMQDARLLGVTCAAPDTEPGADDSTGGAMTGVTSSGGSAEDASILPRHRGTVQRYFQRSVLDSEKVPQDTPDASPASSDTAEP